MRWTFLLILFFGQPAFAANENPSFGLLYSVKENSGIRFKCAEAVGNSLKCEFIQMAVFKKAKESELAEKIEEAKQQFRSSSKQSMNPKDCAEFEDTLAGLRGQKSNVKAEILRSLQSKTSQERADFEKSLVALIAFCKVPNEENVVSLARIAHLKDSKSCRVLTGTFNQTFTRTAPDAWVSTEGPDGLCGVVSVSRLDRVADGNFWVYTTKRIVSNKRAASAPQLCKTLDESEHFFDWKGGPEFYVGCDYVEFGF